MKPIYVALIAIASALFGGLIGAGLGGVVGGATSAGAFREVGLEAGVCSTVETAKAQKLLTSAQADQLKTQSTARLKGLADASIAPNPNPDCQQALDKFKSFSK